MRRGIGNIISVSKRRSGRLSRSTGRGCGLAFLFFLSAVLCLTVGNAQAPPALTLDQCVALARNAPSTVKRARRLLAAAREGVLSAKANFLPKLSVSNTFTYNSPLLYDRGQFSFIALNGVREYSTLGTSSLEVDSAGRLRARRGQGSF